MHLFKFLTMNNEPPATDNRQLIDLKGLNADETRAWVQSLGLEPYRAGQIRAWIFRHLADSFHDMTNISKDLRADLQKIVVLNPLNLSKVQVSKDGSKKYLFQLKDENCIESVLIPETDHDTICISTQVGCAMGCEFCLTAKMGLKRNMTPSEIIEQVIQVRRSLEQPERLTNIVLMGMGEPLANYENVKTALNNLIDSDGMDFSKRKVTLSTCGLVPYMERLGREVKVKLAISLNAADDRVRTRLMPINQTYPLKALLKACREYPLPKGDRITFEYILIRGVNDRDQDAQNLITALSGIQAKINLIALNPHHGSGFSPPPMDRILQFQSILVNKHFTAIIRKSRGQDISAACGQLSGEQGETGE